MWELACLRWHHLGPTDRPSCLHRRQASSHIDRVLSSGYRGFALHHLAYELYAEFAQLMDGQGHVAVLA